MKIIVKPIELDSAKADLIIVGIFEGYLLSETAEKLNELSRGELLRLMKRANFQAKIGQGLPIFQLKNTAFEFLLLIGCGKREELSFSKFRQIMQTTMKSIKFYRVKSAACYLTELKLQEPNPVKIRLMTTSVYDALYTFNALKSEPESPSPLSSMIIHLPEKSQQKACNEAVREAIGIAQGMQLAKDLANLPSNICTPTYLAQEAERLAKAFKSVSTQILDEKAMRKLKMGGILAVSQGSQEEAKLIALSHHGANKKQAPIVLIGKGITFDTGGNSIKPADSMLGMKYDMCGGAAVMGVIKSCAALNIPINVVGIIAAVENMPGGSAFKPDDVITTMSGKTIEIISTDAEGRLVLADALTYCARFRPEVVIDIATLTGAVVIALGVHTAGLWSNHDPLASDLIKAGQESNDRVWLMPLFDEYQEQLKSTIADMSNVGGRAAGAITAACFLSRFAKTYQWAHIDIAGTVGMVGNDRMATGRPVPLLIQYLINRSQMNRSDQKHAR